MSLRKPFIQLYKYAMSWLQVIIEANAQTVESISASLFELGAMSVTLQDAEDQPVYEPLPNETPLWEKIQIIGLFEATDPMTMQTQLQAMLPPYRLQWLADRAWSRLCLNNVQPMQFGRLWICPSWQTPPDPQAINLFLDPGLAFGTGTHATTSLCLEWLAQQSQLKEKIFIDYGCGSGILAVAAVKLGATQVWAVDHDPQALIATKENAEKNGVESHIQVVTPEQLPTIKADGLIANILAIPLCQLAETFADLLLPKAPIVLSGILQAQFAQVNSSYAPYFTITETQEREGWLRIVAHKF